MVRRQTARVRGSMRHSFGVSVSITRGVVMPLALLIEGEARISLGAKAARQTRYKASSPRLREC
jgi:hypothetical protein